MISTIDKLEIATRISSKLEILNQLISELQRERDNLVREWKMIEKQDKEQE